MIALIILFVWVLLLTLYVTSSFIGFVQTRVPFVKTTAGDIEDLARELPITNSDVVMDLGSGDGRVLFLIEHFSKANGIGYELTLWVYWWTLIKKIYKRSKIRFYRKNFFHESWNEATIVYCYLYPPLMGRVEEKFLADCKPGTIAVARDFCFPNLKPKRVIRSKYGPHVSATLGNRLFTNKDRAAILLKSLIPGKLRPSHEFYIYKK